MGKSAAHKRLNKFLREGGRPGSGYRTLPLWKQRQIEKADSEALKKRGPTGRPLAQPNLQNVPGSLADIFDKFHERGGMVGHTFAEVDTSKLEASVKEAVERGEVAFIEEASDINNLDLEKVKHVIIKHPPQHVAATPTRRSTRLSAVAAALLATGVSLPTKYGI